MFELVDIEDLQVKQLDTIHILRRHCLKELPNVSMLYFPLLNVEM